MKIGLAAVLAVSALCSCTEDKPETEAYLPVTANNISGTWELSEMNGTPLADGAYVYLDIVRRDTEFTLYTNVGTFSADIFTGIFHVDEESGVVSGRYDHTLGDWNRSYHVTELTAGRMVWTATDDPSDVSVYVRVDGIPADITGEDASGAEE